MKAEQYLSRVIETLERVKTDEMPLIAEAAQKIVTTIQAGKRVYIFGCTHAGILTEEAFYRTGGLAIFNPIFAPGVTVDNSPITITSAIERLDEYGRVIARQAGLEEGDLLFIHSTSGRNNVPVDLALEARTMGVYVVCLTSLAYSQGVASRHPSGKRLFEVSDLVIDNLCPRGDSMVQLDTSGMMVAPGSTVLGAAILNAIVAAAAEAFEQQNILPPVFLSANLDEGDGHNKKVFERYRKQIRYVME